MLVYTCGVRTFWHAMDTKGGPCDSAKCAGSCYYYYYYYYVGYFHVLLLKKFDQIPVIELSVGSAMFLPFFAARALGSHSNGDHEVHSVYWKCISLLFFRSLPQDCYRTYGPYLIGLIMDRSIIGDFLPLECAEILWSMSFFLLKISLSEQSRFVSSSAHYATCIYNILVVAIHDTCLIVFSFIVLFYRDICCIFSSVKMADVVLWLLKAFVLSRESPSLVQEVCYVMLSCAIVLWTTYNA